jgi:hypothetical protein
MRASSTSSSTGSATSLPESQRRRPGLMSSMMAALPLPSKKREQLRL